MDRVTPEIETVLVFTGHMGYPGGRWKRTCFVRGLFTFTGGAEGALASLDWLKGQDPEAIEWDTTGLHCGASPEPDKWQRKEGNLHEVQMYTVLRVGSQRFGLTTFGTDDLGRFPPDEDSVPRDDKE